MYCNIFSVDIFISYTPLCFFPSLETILRRPINMCRISSQFSYRVLFDDYYYKNIHNNYIIYCIKIIVYHICIIYFYSKYNSQNIVLCIFYYNNRQKKHYTKTAWNSLSERKETQQGMGNKNMNGKNIEVHSLPLMFLSLYTFCM